MAVSVKPKKYDSTAAMPVRVYQTPTRPISKYQESDWINVVDEGIGPGSTGLPNKTRRQAIINAYESQMRDNPNMELGFHHLVGNDPDARRFVFAESHLSPSGRALSGSFSPGTALQDWPEETGFYRKAIVDAIERGEAPFHSAGLTQPGERYDPGDLPLGGGIASLGPKAFKGWPVAFYSPDPVPPWFGVSERREAGIPLGYPAEWETSMQSGGHEFGHAGIHTTRDRLRRQLRVLQREGQSKGKDISADMRARLAGLPPEIGTERPNEPTEEDYIRAVEAKQRSEFSKSFALPSHLRAEERGLEAFPNPLSKKNPVQREALEFLRKYFAGRRLYPPRQSYDKYKAAR